MAARTSIINSSGDYEENIERLAKHLGKDKMRRKLFNTVYGYGTRPRSLKQIMAASNLNTRHRQQAQNQVDHLAKHHLIMWQDNDGSVDDGSRRLYSKDDFVRANKAEIIKYTDHPKRRADLPTKRRPAVKVLQTTRTVTKGSLKKRGHLDVLYLTADPIKNNPLRVDAELHHVQNEIRGSKFRDNITVERRPAATLKSLLNGLNDLNPHIIHFSGHGNKSGIAMDNASVIKPSVEMVSFKLLADALSATDSKPRVVVLNACDSAAARKRFLKLGLIVISMKRSISDAAAAAFAVQFYGALASGQSVKSAFEQGRVAVQATSISEADTPQLFCPKDVDPSKIILA
jgi:CHAT domain